eukprot:CAMPEP_0172853202 /NCGR_PEP_ID=MMETSP1075-20121228/56343_1 /TAXON_ID=2916 /ORGANISM="Ceratium fusus, Strain PA161109" /LENGTH=41 /DNA_ID= /DNA_START= /DNA_END= /DNA_ORIENTATION=
MIWKDTVPNAGKMCRDGKIVLSATRPNKHVVSQVAKCIVRL